VVKLPLQMSYYYINSVSRLKFAGKWNIYSSIKKSVSIFFISYIFVDETPMLWSIINFTNLVPSINLIGFGLLELVFSASLGNFDVVINTPVDYKKAEENIGTEHSQRLLLEREAKEIRENIAKETEAKSIRKVVMVLDTPLMVSASRPISVKAPVLKTTALPQPLSTVVPIKARLSLSAKGVSAGNILASLSVSPAILAKFWLNSTIMSTILDIFLLYQKPFK